MKISELFCTLRAGSLRRILIVGVALAMILLVAGPPGWAAPRLQASSTITYPTDGMTISGVIGITGTAAHPNIAWYEVDYAVGAVPSGGSQWVPLAQVQGSLVEGGVLATWDTTSVPDGVYCVALTVKGQDDPTYYQQFVTNLTVNNANAVPAEPPTPELPTPEPMPTAVPATATPVTIEQPPTATPSSSISGGEGGETTEMYVSAGQDGDDLNLPVSFVDLRNAFLRGGKIVFLLLGMWGLYFVVKTLIRWLLRQYWRTH